jgi:hypothetical protein
MVRFGEVNLKEPKPLLPILPQKKNSGFSAGRKQMDPYMHNARSVPCLTTLQNAFYKLLVVMQSVFPKTSY